MHLIFDADALIKLTKAGAKEIVAAAYTVWIPPAVQGETVVEGKAGGYPDAFQIEANIAAGYVCVVPAGQLQAGPEAELLLGGEREVVAAWRSGAFDAMVSDDRRFLRLMTAFGVPFLTSGAVIVCLAQHRLIRQSQAHAILDALRPWISADEYSVYLLALQSGRSP